MADVIITSTRSKMMSEIPSKNTAPELIIRKGLHSLGFRYRLHNPQLPGKPDLSFPRYRAVILVNGCFWHRHNCHLFKWPKTRKQFWYKKLNDNAERDARNIAELESMGWRVLTIWECALKGKSRRNISEVTHTSANWIKYGRGSAIMEGYPAVR
jgi:DNA mismatch endonuclease, patch repair protein